MLVRLGSKYACLCSAPFDLAYCGSLSVEKLRVSNLFPRRAFSINVVLTLFRVDLFGAAHGF